MSNFFDIKDCEIKSIETFWNASAGAFISLEKANRLLRERGTVVYGEEIDEGYGRFMWSNDDDKFSTHKALLIQPIEREDTAESLLKELVNTIATSSIDGVPHSIGLKAWHLLERAKKLLEKK